MLKLLTILLTIPMTLFAMEHDDIKYEKVHLIHQPLVTSIEGKHTNGVISPKPISIVVIANGNEPVTQTMAKRLGQYHIGKEDIDIEMQKVFNEVFPTTHRTIGTQVSTFSPEPFTDYLKRSCVETCPALMVGSMTSVSLFLLMLLIY